MTTQDHKTNIIKIKEIITSKKQSLLSLQMIKLPSSKKIKALSNKKIKPHF